MPHARVSGVLNNCALHALVPELLDQLLKFSLIDKYDNGYKEEYARLKTVFARYYKLKPSDLTWQRFAELLAEFNPFEIQLVLGPVLRQFMRPLLARDKNLKEVALAEELKPNELVSPPGMDEKEEEHYINSCKEVKYLDGLTQLLPGGRYAPLPPDVLAQFVAAPLGISIIYHRAQDKQGTKLLVEPSLACVSIFHEGALSGGHWERAPKEAKQEIIHYQPEGQFVNLVDLFSFGKSDEGLSKLKAFVNNRANQVMYAGKEKAKPNAMELLINAVISYQDTLSMSFLKSLFLGKQIDACEHAATRRLLEVLLKIQDEQADSSILLSFLNESIYNRAAGLKKIVSQYLEKVTLDECSVFVFKL